MFGMINELWKVQISIPLVTGKINNFICTINEIYSREKHYIPQKSVGS